MSGIGRYFADRELRNASTMRAAQARYDSLAPDDDESFDEDWLTEDQALDQARDELLALPSCVVEALSHACDTPEASESVAVSAIVTNEDEPLDCVTVETLAVHQLLAIVMIGADKPAMVALRELRERVARELANDIADRARALLTAQERERRRQRDDAQAEAWLDRQERAA